jgi:metal-responsive CopG/Arc/MetJ family transcriptional regulator
MKTSVEIPDDLWKAAKHFAIEQGIDLRDVIVKALEEYLKKAKGGKK